jgi:hypothetical protein
MLNDASLRRVLSENNVKLLGDLIRASLWAVLALAWLACGWIYVRLATLLVAGTGSSDFTIFYYTARMIAEGRPMYGDLPGEYGLSWEAKHLGNLNPPHFNLLLLPLVPLGYRGALLCWGLINVVLAAVSLWLIARELSLGRRLKRLLVIGVAVLGSAPWTTVMITGEMSLLLLLPFTLAWLAWRRGHWGGVGAWIGVCASFKLFFFLFLVWFAAARRWRAVFAMCTVVLLLVACGTAAFGFDSYVHWQKSLARVGWWWLPMNASVRGLTERLFNPGPTLAPLYRDPRIALTLWMVCSVAIATVSAWALRPTRTVYNADRTAMALLCTALLLSPLGWVYYLPLATGPALALAAGGEATRRPVLLVLAMTGMALLYLPLELVESQQPSRLATLLLASAYSWAILSWWAALVISKPASQARAT